MTKAEFIDHLVENPDITPEMIAFANENVCDPAYKRNSRVLVIELPIAEDLVDEGRYPRHSVASSHSFILSDTCAVSARVADLYASRSELNEVIPKYTIREK